MNDDDSDGNVGAPGATPARPHAKDANAVSRAAGKDEASVSSPRRRKQVLLATGLGVVFGPVGLLYCTWPGAAAMAGVNVVAAILTHGEALVFTWPMSGLLGSLAALAHNAEIEVEHLVGPRR